MLKSARESTSERCDIPSNREDTEMYCPKTKIEQNLGKGQAVSLEPSVIIRLDHLAVKV